MSNVTSPIYNALKVIYRLIREEDMDKIKDLCHELKVHCPLLSPFTVVAEDQNGKIIAAASPREVIHVDFVMEDTLAGNRAGVKTMAHMEHGLRSRRVPIYQVGVSMEKTRLRQHMRDLGYETWGEVLYEKPVSDVISDTGSQDEQGRDSEEVRGAAEPEPSAATGL